MSSISSLARSAVDIVQERIKIQSGKLTKHIEALLGVHRPPPASQSVVGDMNPTTATCQPLGLPLGNEHPGTTLRRSERLAARRCDHGANAEGAESPEHGLDLYTGESFTTQILGQPPRPRTYSERGMDVTIPSDMEKMQLYKTIESKSSLSVAYRARQCDTITVPQSTTFSWRLSVNTSPEKPRYIIIAFQTNRDGNQEANSSIFDHCDLKNMFVMMNQDRYPAVDYNLSFPNQQFSRAYRAAATFSEKFYGMDQIITQSNITPLDFKDLFPIFVYDVSKQSERLKSSVVDIQIKSTFNAAVPAGTEAYAVVISDKLLEFQSDGQKLSVVYGKNL